MSRVALTEQRTWSQPSRPPHLPTPLLRVQKTFVSSMELRPASALHPTDTHCISCRLDTEPHAGLPRGHSCAALTSHPQGDSSPSAQQRCTDPGRGQRWLVSPAGPLPLHGTMEEAGGRRGPLGHTVVSGAGLAFLFSKICFLATWIEP